MFSKFFSDKFVQQLSDKITSSVNESLKTFEANSEDKMDKILTHVEALRLELKSLDERLTSKELRDKSEYGHVQYKLSSLQKELMQEKRKEKEDLDSAS